VFSKFAPADLDLLATVLHFKNSTNKVRRGESSQSKWNLDDVMKGGGGRDLPLGSSNQHKAIPCNQYPLSSILLTQLGHSTGLKILTNKKTTLPTLTDTYLT
jgi:hypothetical protein